MKNENGIGLISAIIVIAITMFIIVGAVNVGLELYNESKLKDLKTDMLLVQAKAKSHSEEVSFQTVNLKDTDEKVEEVKKTEYIGTKLIDCSDEIKKLANDCGVTEIKEYYCLDNEDLKHIGVDIKLDEGEYYLVKYDIKDAEIVYTKGFKYKGQVYYKLSQLNNID